MSLFLKSFLLGFFSAFDGYRILKNKPFLKKWFWIPFAIYILLFILSFSWFSTQIPIWVQQALAMLPLTISPSGWGAWIYYPVLFMLWLVFLFLSIYILFSFGSILAAPFNALMAEKLLVEYEIIHEERFSIKKWLSFTFKMLWVSLKKMVVFAFIGIFIFIISFVPGLNIVSIYLAMAIVAFDSFDYYFEVLGWNLRQRMMFFRSHLPIFLGLALFFLATLILPGMTLFLIPLSIVGAGSIIKNLKDNENDSREYTR